MTENLTRRPEKALTAQVVRNASEPGKYFDGHGLFLKVNEGGGKSWVQRIVIRGKRRELGLGSAQLVSLAEARGAALHNRKVARAGGDPLATKREAANAPTFQQAAERAIAQHAASWQSERHGAIQLSLIKRYAFPVIGDLKLKDITTADILRVLSPIWTEKPETARRLPGVQRLASRRGGVLGCHRIHNQIGDCCHALHPYCRRPCRCNRATSRAGRRAFARRVRRPDPRRARSRLRQ